MKLAISLIFAATAVTVAIGGNPQYLRQPDSGSLETDDSADYDKSSKYASLKGKEDDDDLSVDLAELFDKDLGSLDGSDLELNIMSLIGSGSNQVPAHKVFEAITKMEGLLNSGSLDDLEDVTKSLKGASKGDLDWLNNDGDFDKNAGKGGFADYASQSSKSDDKLPYNDDEPGDNDYLTTATKASKGDTEWLEDGGSADVPMEKGGYTDFARKPADVSTKTGGQSNSAGPSTDDDNFTPKKGPYMGDELTWLDGSDGDTSAPIESILSSSDVADIAKFFGAQSQTGAFVKYHGSDDDDVKIITIPKADDSTPSKGTYNGGENSWLEASDSDDVLANKGGYADYATKSAGTSTKTGGPTYNDDDTGSSNGLDDESAEESDDTATKASFASKSAKFGDETPYVGKTYSGSGLGLIGDSDLPKKSKWVPVQEDIGSALDDRLQM
ncbi:uncharacterized protein PHALS_00694 [Plasmopara halstedii]|uniref:RxLR-like protein n=1 Tax=Plasmopara halstedii TaxID=4781 RepID=A0A0P1ASV8_PLAHL|nr:uncharacterized protein PHALS_00694 [Plasmopara halstedii]CEG44325.1 hypothetical protein PHALS_00694 [Plasmopara halstedii]|eukprot:XP_024580694.1 hypothetical protein PHALS_00694 [Plasmopara halstedii]